jgi:hypothetical protein
MRSGDIFFPIKKNQPHVLLALLLDALGAAVAVTLLRGAGGCQELSQEGHEDRSIFLFQ